MKLDDLIKQRKPDWERLTVLMQRIERGQIGNLSEAELTEFGQLYRATTSDLALAQRDYPQHPLTLYLNQLVGRAHPLVYRGDPLILRQLKEFYLRGFPRLYRELFPFIFAAALLFFGTGIVTYFVTVANPAAANYLLSPGLISDIKDGTPWWKDLNEANQVGATVIMANNLRVSFFAFAGGMVAGLLTIYVLIANGLDLGAVFGLLQVYGHAGPLWEFVIGHGVLELSEITMTGGSGLMLAYAILQPGLLSRKDALTVAAQKSIRLLLGSAPLLLIAGAIEGFVSPSAAPVVLKYTIGIASGVLLYTYLFLAGRPKIRDRFARRALAQNYLTK
jgi:uncharacterized membrane protein SpoIIM required for sporulation